MNFLDKLEKYAELAVRVGVNIKPGEELVIRTPIECAELARLAMKHAYKAGAKQVYVEYNDEKANLIHFMNAPDEAFDSYPEWKVQKYMDVTKRGGAFLTISGSDPDLMKDVNPERILRSQRASSKALKEWYGYMLADKFKWCIVSAPTESWAKKVFPGVDGKEAVEKLWDKIFQCSRVTEDPVKEWEIHNKNLDEKTKFLNENDFRMLKYKSATADLEIELPENHLWQSGASYDPKGNAFNANIPTEEIYGMPSKFGINGKVKSTKPLVISGNTVENFEIKFEKGRIVDFSAEKGYETLEKLIATDEGAHYLGEMALVPFDSPISNTDMIFYDTLYDENASCHLAIGAAYTTNMVDGDKIKEEDYDKHGINNSMVHEDFMIGSSDLDIVGIRKDGKEVQIFKDGNWAF